jgi:hypothetical protein
VNILTQIPRKIEQRKSPLQEVGRQLAKIGSSGSFATRLTVAAGDLHLEVQGVGRIRFPITPSTARRLCAAARPARHGFTDETRLDQGVRDTWEIAKSRISIDQFRWMNTLAPQLDRICRGLGLPQGCRLKAQLYNMLVYAPGQFFAPHQDSEKTDDMIGTLVVSLPSRFTGGAMSIEHHGAKMRVGGPTRVSRSSLSMPIVTMKSARSKKAIASFSPTTWYASTMPMSLARRWPPSMG